MTKRLMTQRPNFSGIWVADFAQSKLEIEAPESSLFKVRHEDPSFAFSRTHKAKDYENTISLEMSTDGKEFNISKNNIEIRGNCKWQGETLVFESRLLRGSSEGRNVVRYRLSQDGRQITADERYDGEPKSYHNIWVLNRKNE